MDAMNQAAVWQRVQGQEPPPEAGLMGLIAQEMEDAAIYLQLSRRLSGKHAVTLRQMYEEELSHAACLKGIYSLLTGSQPGAKGVPPLQEDIKITLRRCYGREMRCLAQYEARASHREYGPIFIRLAQQEQDHCRRILEILGSL